MQPTAAWQKAHVRGGAQTVRVGATALRYPLQRYTRLHTLHGHRQRAAVTRENGGGVGSTWPCSCSRPDS